MAAAIEKSSFFRYNGYRKYWWGYALMKKFVCLLMLCLALLICVGAAAEEEFATVQGKLISQGEFPDARPSYSRASTEGLEEYLISKLSAGATEINVLKYGLSVSSFVDFYWDMLNSNPELFYVAGELSYYSEEGLMKSILPKYVFTGDELQSRIDEFEGYVSSIARYASVAKGEIGQLMRVNDYFCVNYQYDTDLDIYRPDLLFRNKEGVCQAYMLAYGAVLNKLGIENTYATSSAMNHIWNLVKLDGEWYHIDVTWNDPVSDLPLRACHYYFLLSDEAIENAKHYGWSSSVTADSDLYDDAFWRSLDTPLPVQGNDIYYYSHGDSNGKRSIYKWEESSGQSTLIHSFPIASYYYPGYMGLAADSNFLYYGADDTLYSIGLEGGNPAAIHVLQEEGALIWSAWREGSTIRMLTGADLYGDVVTADIPNWSSELAIMPSAVRLEIDETARLCLVQADDPETTLAGAWASSDINIASVSKKGVVTGKSRGIVKITAMINNEFAEASVVVHGKDCVFLPASMTAVGDEAFMGIAAEEIHIPDGVTSIGERAFAGCAGLKIVIVPDSVLTIGDNAFADCHEELAILVSEGSAAHSYAEANGVGFILVD